MVANKLHLEEALESGVLQFTDSQILVSSVLLTVLFKPLSYTTENINLPFLQDM